MIMIARHLDKMKVEGGVKFLSRLTQLNDKIIVSNETSLQIFLIPNIFTFIEFQLRIKTEIRNGRFFLF